MEGRFLSRFAVDRPQWSACRSVIIIRGLGVRVSPLPFPPAQPSDLRAPRDPKKLRSDGAHLLVLVLATDIMLRAI